MVGAVKQSNQFYNLIYMLLNFATSTAISALRKYINNRASSTIVQVI